MQTTETRTDSKSVFEIRQWCVEQATYLSAQRGGGAPVDSIIDDAKVVFARTTEPVNAPTK